MKLALINGPNLNRLASREEKFYGKEDFSTILDWLKASYPDVEIIFFQSNSEGEIIDRIQTLENEKFRGLILNPAGYSHYSIAIRDAVEALPIPTIEVHLSNIFAREPFRQISVISAVSAGVISGFGKHSYKLAIEWFLSQKPKEIGFKTTEK